ncbi:hypothetical protein GE061_017256 [Apolygus lucorum]|uniref:Uncharacterized protein n=1 Tax=Apolygus lucorum TaxID=248454 RepID=A0A8S9XCL6_APOLU|nr:hypothetical protein GE061_017256 [Apolygus lucorum]
MIASAAPLCHTIQRYYDALGRVQVDVCNEDSVTEEKHYGSDISRVTCSLKDGQDERTVSVILKESTLDKMINEAIEENVHFTSELQILTKDETEMRAEMQAEDLKLSQANIPGISENNHCY